MKEHDLYSPPGAHVDSKRLGRGVGSGRGKTAGRGTKGQKARTGGQIARWFQGGQNPIHKKLPYKRGFHNHFRIEYNEINVGQLEGFPAGSALTIEDLFVNRLARRAQLPVKILGVGELTTALVVQAHAFSKSAREKIEAAGGSVEVLPLDESDEAPTDEAHAEA